MAYKNLRNIRKTVLPMVFFLLATQMTAQTATVYTTTSDGSLKLSKEVVAVQSGKSLADKQLLFNTSVKYQTIEGFGFALTYASCYNLMQMSQENRDSFLRRTYSPTEGYGVSYAH